jgi:hypothetical protein
MEIVVGRKLRGLRGLIQAKQRFPSNPGCIKLERPTATRDTTNVDQRTQQQESGGLPKEQTLDDIRSIRAVDRA